MKGLMKIIVGVAAGAMLWGMSAFAAESVTPVNMIMYSNEYTVLYAEPDLTSTVIVPNEGFPLDTPIQVTGVTDSGFIQIDLNGTYYISGDGLNLEPSTIQVAAGTSEASAALDLTGNWEKQNPGDSYQAGYIVGDIIEIYWIMDGGESHALYWSGSYVAPTEDTNSYSWVSVNNTDRTHGKLLASSVDTKTFTYKNGVLSYSVSMLGVTTTYKLVPTATDYTVFAN